MSPLSPLHQKILVEAQEQREGRRHTSPAPRPKAATKAAPAALLAALPHQTIAGLASIICDDWEAVNANVYNAARPYVRAMSELHFVGAGGGYYGADSAAMIVRYFLVNATGWRGPVARAVKAELKRRLK